MVRGICKPLIQVNSPLTGYYLNGFLSTRPGGGYTLARYMFL
jgi:hypothetical protein